MTYQDRYGDRYRNGHEDEYGDQTVPRDERAGYRQPRPDRPSFQPQPAWPDQRQAAPPGPRADWQGQQAPPAWPGQRQPPPQQQPPRQPPRPGQRPAQRPAQRPGWQGQQAPSGWPQQQQPRPDQRAGWQGRQDPAWQGQRDQWPGRQQPPRQGGYPRPRAAAQPLPQSGGATGNERLTAMTGAVLLVLLATEGLTILQIRSMLTLHFFLGMLLVGPVALKASSTMYRFFRYYTGHPEYKKKGPPAPLLRLLGPFVLLLSLSVIGTGVMLAFTGPGQSTWLFLHKASFVLWFCVMAVHVLAYAPRLPRLLSAEARGIADQEGDPGEYPGDGRRVSRAAEVLGGRRTRLLLLIASLVAGLVIAMLTVHLAGPWEYYFNG